MCGWQVFLSILGKKNFSKKHPRC